MKIKFFGQNCFLFNHYGKTILSDPFYNFQKEQSGFNINSQNIDYVIITHDYEDHTTDVREVLSHHLGSIVIGTPEICGYFAHPNNIDLNIGGSAL